MKKRVLVIGGGPAGLAAGCDLLERAGDHLSVELINMGHHLGGKANSYRDPEGHIIEHGLHIIVGFYDRMRGLMERAGIDLKTALKAIDQTLYVYENSDGQLHELDKSMWSRKASLPHYDGISPLMLPSMVQFSLQLFLDATGGKDLTQFDDVCIRTYCAERGLHRDLIDTNLFHGFKEPYFNGPYPMSAYHALKSLQHMNDAQAAKTSYATGGTSEVIWDPIGEYFKKLGGTLTPYTMATDWVYEGNEIKGVKVSRPDSGGHDHGTSSWKGAQVPRLQGSERVLDGFDAIISTIPQPVFVQMNQDDEAMWASPYFKRIRNLRSVATASMTVLTEKPVMEIEGGVVCLPPPLSTCSNMKTFWTEYTQNSDYGSVLVFTGPETGYEDWTDEQIIEHTLDNMGKIDRVGDIRAAGIKHIELHRNKSAFERLILTEPGVNPFRPGPKTPFHNLFLAGDWIRNPVDIITMEGAIASGYQAVDHVLEELEIAGPRREAEVTL
jgi:protoporphyrinogen oxidase